MEEYRLQILYPRGAVRALASDFNVAGATIRNALRFATMGEQADQIRDKAVEDYCCVLTKIPIRKGAKRKIKL